MQVFYEDLSMYDYQDEDAFTDRESGFYVLWYRPAYTRLNVGWLKVGRPLLTGTLLCPEDVAPEGNGEVRIPVPHLLWHVCHPPPTTTSAG